MEAAIDQLLWSVRADAHARSYRLGGDDETFWRAYALLQHPDRTPGCESDPDDLDATWLETGRELSELHLHWRTVGGWPPGEPLPAEAHDWRVRGVRVLDLAPEEPRLAARLGRVALQTVRRIAALPPLPPQRGVRR